MVQINVAIAGIGNLATGLVEALQYYKANQDLIGVSYPSLGGYLIEDIKIVAAFDIDDRKVGKDITDAVRVSLGAREPFVENLEPLGIEVRKGPVEDGISEMTKDVIPLSSQKEVDVAKVLKETNADILVIAVPTGATKAVYRYAEAAIKADVAVLNATPTPLARDPSWARKFKEARIPLAGDDIQSKAGGTVIHKGILDALTEQGVRVVNTYQLDVSGGLEGLNTLDVIRRAYKRGVKEDTIRRAMPYPLNVASGTTDHLEFLGDRRIGHFWIEARYFMNAPLRIDLRMESYDSPNGAATLVDAIRAIQIARNHVISGPITAISAYCFKAAPVIVSRLQAKKWFEDFVNKKTYN